MSADRDYRWRQKRRSDKAASAVRCPRCKAPPHVECNYPEKYCLERRVAGDANRKAPET
jgi:hypothetical protein